MKKRKQSNKLLQALEFVSLAQSSKGSEMQTHCIVSGRTIAAFDGVLACGHVIEEDLEACPQTEEMLLALSRCTDEFAITQLSGERLQIRSGDFLAFVPCCERSKLPEVNPDDPAGVISPSLSEALWLAAPLLNEKAKDVSLASIQINSGSLLATDSKVLLEVWHGHDLPNNVLVPKRAAKAIATAGKQLQYFGYSGHTATFWFDDRSWIRTQLYSDAWAEKVTKGIKEILAVQPNPRPVPVGFFEAAKKVEPFSRDGMIYCTENTVSSHPSTGAMQGGHLTLEVESGISPRSYPAKSLAMVAKLATSIDDTTLQGVTLFFGSNLRGAMVHVLQPKERFQHKPGEITEDFIDDIPF